MLGHNLPLALLGLGALTRGAPTPPRTNHVRNTAPPSCIAWVWELAQICVVSPPTTTTGPSKERDFIGAVAGRDADVSYPTGCIPRVLQEWKLCILAPPTTTITPSTKRDELKTLVDRDDFTPTPTSTNGCIPIILEEFNICIVGPPTTTIVPSTKRDWSGLGPAAVRGFVPDKTIPGGALILDHYVPGGTLVPGVPVPGTDVTSSA